jgi:hypothetical protein
VARALLRVEEIKKIELALVSRLVLQLWCVFGA